MPHFDAQDTADRDAKEQASDPRPVRLRRPDHPRGGAAALAEHGDDAKIIAGGQSLLPVLRMRLNAPEVVIDLGKIESLRGIRDDGDAIVIGAMTTHDDVLHDALVAEHASADHQGGRDGRRPADPAPRHLRRRAGARRPGRRPRGAGARARTRSS